MSSVKPLTRRLHALHYRVGGEKRLGLHERLEGNCSGLRGDCTGLRGDCTGLEGDCTGLEGDCTGLRGDCTGLEGNCSGLEGNCSGLEGNLDAIPVADREKAPQLSMWTQPTEETPDAPPA